MADTIKTIIVDGKKMKFRITPMNVKYLISEVETVKDDGSKEIIYSESVYDEDKKVTDSEKMLKYRKDISVELKKH